MRGDDDAGTRVDEGKYQDRKANVTDTIKNLKTADRRQNSSKIKSDKKVPQPKKNLKEIKIGHLNVERGIVTKKDQIEIFLDDENVDIFLVSEHGLSDNKIELINLQNFTLVHHYSRKAHRWGGTAIFTKNNLNLTATDIEDKITKISKETVFEPSISLLNYKTLT